MFNLNSTDCEVDQLFTRYRCKVVVNSLRGDQSNREMIDFAKRVNPLESLKMLEQELNDLDKLLKKRSKQV